MSKESRPASKDWGEDVSFAEGPEGRFAYRAHQLIVRGEPAKDVVLKLYSEARSADEDDGSFLITLPEQVDVLALVADLRDDGYRAEPNYVLFAHELEANPLYGNPLWGNPLWGNPLWGNPLYGNPLWGNPLWGNPLYGNPLYGNPLYFDQYQMTGIRPSTARPAPEPIPAPTTWTKSRRSPSIIILDTGLAKAAYRPPFLNSLGPTALTDQDSPDEDGDPYAALDPVAGHGTFIAGIIERLIPGRKLALGRVLSTLGDTSAWDVGRRLGGLTVDEYTILNLSFGGHAADLQPGEMWYLARAVRKVQQKRAVVVASAGNDATSRRSYPGCLPGVVAVAALSSNGPAPFTNYGPWVRACAPGTNVVSSFFTNFDGPVEVGVIDPDEFQGWARWSGTSFAAPVVVAALAREMVRTNCTAGEAVTQVIDTPGLLAVPGLGTVVNIS